MFDENRPENGRWSALEHQLFLKGLQQHGKNWGKIEMMISTRSSSQIRSHAQKFFSKLNQQNSKDQSVSPISTHVEPEMEPQQSVRSSKRQDLIAFLHRYQTLKLNDDQSTLQNSSKSLFLDMGLDKVEFWRPLASETSKIHQPKRI